jgi:hypothetical protein
MNGVLLDPAFTLAFESLLATSIPLYRSAVSAAEIGH